MTKFFYNFVLDSIDTSRRKSINRLISKASSKKIVELEHWFESMLPSNTAAVVSSGRFGLAVLLEHLVKQKGVSEANVVIPGFSCVVVSNSVRAANCEVRYADICPKTLNLSIDSVQGLIDANTIAIVVQHIFGLTDKESISDLKKAFPSVWIIEDCAHALGGRYPDGQFVGGAGDFAFYSFEQSKMVTAWTGGVVVGKVRAAIHAVRMAQQKCEPSTLKSDLRLFIMLVSHYWGYRKSSGFLVRLVIRIICKLLQFEHSIDDAERRGEFNPYKLKRFSPRQAACVLDQLKVIEENVEHRRRISNVYASKLSTPFKLSDGAAVLRFPMWVADKKSFMQRCASEGVVVGDWFSTPVHPCDPEINQLGYRLGDCPQAELLVRHIVNLPTALQLNINDANNIAQIAISSEPSLELEALNNV